MAQINFPVATADGQTFEAPTGVIYTYTGTPPNGFWSGSFGIAGLNTLDARYVEKTGDSMTGNLTLGSSASLGIGTNSPDAALKIQASNSDNPATSFAIRQNNAADSAQTSFSIEASPTDGVSRLISSATSTPQLALYTGGNEAVRIDSSSNVGIGTSTDLNQRLCVQGSSNDTIDETKGTLKVEASGGNGLLLGTYASSPYSSYIQSAYVQDTSTARYNLLLNPIGGNVGIGTSSPASALNVQTNTATGPSLTYDSANILNLDYGTIQLAVGIDPSSPFGSYLQSRDNTNGARTLNLNPAGGNVGIGRSDPAQALDVEGHIRVSTGSAGLGFIQFGDDTNSFDNYHIGSNGVGGFEIFNKNIGQGISMMSIDSNANMTVQGNLGIGTSSAGARTHIVNTGQATNALNTAGSLSLIASESGGGVNNGGSVVFAAASGAWRFAAIKGLVTNGANNTEGDLAFFTRQNSTDSTLTERMRIHHEGQVLIGTSSLTVSSLYKLQVIGSRGAMIKSTGGGGAPTLTLWNNNSSGDSNLIDFRVNVTDATVGGVAHDRSAGLVVYNTTSDYRAKTLNGRVRNSGSVIDQLKVYNGTMNGATLELPMLVAHEAQEVVPYCVTGTKDEVDSDGNPIYQGMDVSKLVPLLIAEIQDLRKRLSDANID